MYITENFTTGTNLCLWPARSPDLNPIDYFMWDNLKNVVYKTKPEIIEELKKAIY